MTDLVKEHTSDKLSGYRTAHRFRHYGEFRTLDEFKELRAWAKERSLPVYILGNGSNTFFAHSTVNSLVLVNKMPRVLEPIEGDPGHLRVSAATLIATILKHCRANSLDAPYYLASVPASVGGALAMNAGRGHEHNRTIYDFCETLTVLDEDDQLHTLKHTQVPRAYRTTPFTGVKPVLIVEATLRFESKHLEKDFIAERVAWSKTYQDHRAPNCGSVFKRSHFPLLWKLRYLRYGKTRFSRKTLNWLLCESKSPTGLRVLIATVRIIHRLFGKKAVPEVIIVE
ncbi:MAG: FAD-binding protein [Planctomycetota bacterium]